MQSYIQKFSREIQALKRLGSENALHPLRQEQLKASILARIKDGPVAGAARVFSAARRQKALYYVMTALAGVTLVGGTAFASTRTLPGDALYSVKKTTEKVKLVLAASESGKATVQAQQAQERIDELQKLKVKAQTENSKSNTELVNKTESETKTEVTHTIQVLLNVQTELENKGNTKAAAAVSANVEKLKNKAVEAQIITEQDNSGQPGNRKGQDNQKDKKDAKDNPLPADSSGNQNAANPNPNKPQNENKGNGKN